MLWMSPPCNGCAPVDLHSPLHSEEPTPTSAFDPMRTLGHERSANRFKARCTTPRRDTQALRSACSTQSTIADVGIAPDVRATSRPFLIMTMLGMPRMP